MLREIEGVRATRVGYTGGTIADPSYEQVCRHATGHAEAVEVTFDPAAVSFEQLLGTFWRIHNPTTLNRQGWDMGSQYRSAVFVHGADQMTWRSHHATTSSRRWRSRSSPIAHEHERRRFPGRTARSYSSSSPR